MKVTPTKSHSESEISPIKFDEDVVENTPKRKSFSTSYLIASPSPIKDRSFLTPSFLKTPRQTDHFQKGFFQIVNNKYSVKLGRSRKKAASISLTLDQIIILLQSDNLLQGHNFLLDLYPDSDDNYPLIKLLK